MKKNIIILLVAILMITSATSFSAFSITDNGTVLIGTKSFGLAYANDTANIIEITNAIVQGGAIYVKDFSGNWIDNNTGKSVDVSIIPGEDGGQVPTSVVASADAINITKNIGDVYTLPSTVTARLANVTSKQLAVTWDKVADTKSAGEFTFIGTLSIVDGVVNPNNVTIIAKLTVVKSNQELNFKTGTYVGDFVDGKRQGKGKFTWENGDIYDGEWLNDNMSGEGTFSYESKDTYFGNYKDNVKNGQGIYTWNNGEIYNGVWEDDTMNGIGEYDFINGDFYKGEWEDGKMNGEGTYTFLNGDSIVKNWNSK
ncbi:Ig-like domain-containing protein [Clostridium estertheticum]|uniref:Ig-like domain-containing protein n=1 Tax=Clostridium estertheticum TaxID=238834 RepID=UPI001C7DE175|nr:Ig-like domain-containing protein [Clostridium estertheticum]MBX4264479.1 Ig-like domain-containing protein [Clostridium estertheticum]WLC89317.1 Ig-like domain-containing protein [Clostridium estertheticum]